MYSMIIRLKLNPGQKGTKKLTAEYGEALVCVRYRYDEHRGVRFKTVELIVESKPWKVQLPSFEDTDLVPVHIGFSDATSRECAKAAKGRWDPDQKAMVYPVRKDQGNRA